MFLYTHQSRSTAVSLNIQKCFMTLLEVPVTIATSSLHIILLVTFLSIPCWPYFFGPLYYFFSAWKCFPFTCRKPDAFLLSSRFKHDLSSSLFMGSYLIMYTCILSELISPLRVELGTNMCLCISNECVHILSLTLSSYPVFCETLQKVFFWVSNY